MLSVGGLVWESSGPLIRLVLGISAGFILTKLNKLPASASRGTGQILINVALPCLIFSRIVSEFDANNIGVLGTLVLVAMLYQTLGLIFAWIIKQVFWVPHRFRYGILVAGGWGNIGDIPTVILSVTASSPFRGASDQNLAVAYTSVFVLVFMTTLFTCGAHHWIAMDFVGPDVEPEEIQEMTRLRRLKFFRAARTYISRAFGRRSRELDGGTHDNEKGVDLSRECAGPNGSAGKEVPPGNCICDAMPSSLPCDSSINSQVSFHNPGTSFYNSTPTIVDVPQSSVASPSSTVITIVGPAESVLPTVYEKAASDLSVTRSPGLSRFSHAIRDALLTPQSFAIITSLTIAFFDPLKAFFVPVPSSTSIPIPRAPDGEPALAVVLGATAFMAAAAIPLSLVTLGSAFARLSIPRNKWSSLPLGAIVALAITKVVVTPLIGVGIVKGFMEVGLISKEDKVLQFVCVFFACVPTSTIQVYMTQVQSGTGSAEHLVPFYIPQFILMFFSMTGLVAYMLEHLF